jgi:hypothetical protein
MDTFEFIDELPASGGLGAHKSAYRAALEAHPGQWAEYPGKPASAYTVAKQMSTNGMVFEAAVRAGIAYMRCVKP